MPTYLAQQFAASRQLIEPLPPLEPDVLTFARAKVLFNQVLNLNTEGHVQQFLIASLLFVDRGRHGIEITTNHPHAADRYGRRAGDVEETLGGDLVRAYEVTMRDDWQNRISPFQRKMDEFGLVKYTIIARGINAGAEWSVPPRWR